MGQIGPSPAPHKALVDFVNLPKEAIMSLWLAYNLTGEGWSLELDQFIAIFHEASFLREHYAFTEDQLRAVFKMFDTDANGLVDALETLAVFGLISGMDAVEKIFFVFNIYDFGSKGFLSNDETNLLFRSVTKGLAKISSAEGFASATPDDGERFADLLFQAMDKPKDGGTVDSEQFKSYSLTHPVVSNWLRAASSLDIPRTQNDKGIVAEHERGRWLSALNDKFVAPKTQAMAHTLKPDELATALQEVSLAEPAVSLNATMRAPDQAQEGPLPTESEVAEPVPLWVSKVSRLRPEEMPVERTDLPEDAIESLWIGGLNVRRLSVCASLPVNTQSTTTSAHTTSTDFASTQMQRCVRYRTSASDAMLYTAGTHVIVLKKNDESALWSQQTFNEHNHAISALDVNYAKDLLVTADRTVLNDNAAKNRLVVWELSTMRVKHRWELPASVQCVDINALGTLVLVVYEDVGSTLAVMEIHTGKCVFSKKLLHDRLADRVNDVRFFGTTSMIGVALEQQGMKFFIDEETGVMGKANMRLYEERDALYGNIGAKVVSTAATAIARLELPDELATATATGEIILWRGRTVSQVIPAHRGRVLALDFHLETRTLVSGGEDGHVFVFEINDTSSNTRKRAQSARGPRPLVTRTLALSAQFDILRHASLAGHVIASITLSHDARRALLATSTHELLEIVCKLSPPSAEEMVEDEAAAAAAAAEGEGEEGAASAGKTQLGDDVHGGPIVAAHFLPSLTSVRKSESDVFLISAACKVGANGFATCGSDATVRLWQPQGEGEGEGDKSLCYKAVKTIKTDAPCTAISASPASLAVALFGGENTARDGAVQLFSLPEGAFIGELPRDADNECDALCVRDIKCSAEGTLFAVLRSDNSIQIFTQTEGVWQKKGTLPSKEETLECFDLTTDNLFLRAFFSSSGDFKVFDISTSFGTEIFATLPPPVVDAPPLEEGDEPPPVPGAAILEQLRSMQWASQTCAFNWDSTASAPLRRVSSSPSSLLMDRVNHLLLCATREGEIDVNRLPAVSKLVRQESGVAGQRLLFAHTSRMCALFFFEESGAKLFTAGAHDGVMRVWKVTYDTDEFEPDIAPSAEDEKPGEEEEEEGEEGAKKKLQEMYDSGEEEDLEDGPLLKRHLRRERKVFRSAKSADDDTETETKSETETEGEEHPSSHKSLSQTQRALKNYAKALGATNAHSLARSCANALTAAQPTLLPTDELVMDWIYGCSARQTRNAVRYTSEGLIVYPAGSVCVIYDKIAAKQTRVQAHRDEITALDVHIPRQLGVSAHKGLGHILAFIWRTTDGVVQRTLDCGPVNGVSAIKFSPCGAYVAVAAQDAQHHVLIFSVDDGVLLAKVRGGTEKALSLAFSELPYGPHNAPTLRLVVGGVKHFKVLSFNAAARTLHSKTGLYGADVRKSNVTCLVALPLSPVPEGETVTGNEFLLALSDGSIGVIARGENKISSMSPTVKGPITAMVVTKTKSATAEEPAQYKVVVGGTQGAIKVLDAELQPIAEFNLYKKEHGLYAIGRVRGFKSLSVDKLSRKLLFATAAGEIGEIDLSTGENLNHQQPLVHAHFRDRLRALATHPLRQECLTAGEDKSLRVWDLETHSQIAIIELPGPAISATFAPNGHLIVASLSRKEEDPFGGRLCIVSYLQGKTRIVHHTNDARAEIVCVIFSPDGSKVFAASLDGAIYVYDALNNFRLLRTINAHTEGVLSLDISADGKHLVAESVTNAVSLWELRGFTCVSVPQEAKDILADIEKKYFVRQNLFGLNSVGVFPSLSAHADAKSPLAGENVHADNAALLSLAQSRDAKLLATGDENGQLHLFLNPAVSLGAPHRNYAAHSPGGLSKTSFSAEDQFLLTVGLQDKLLIQWKVVKNSASADPATSIAAKNALVCEENAYKATTVAGEDLEDAFEKSFSIKGVSFAEESKSVAAHKPSAAAQLLNIIGSGCGVSRSLPSAQFCGHGELVLAAGKTVYAVQGESSNQKLSVWNIPTLTTLASSSGTQDEKNKTLHDVGSIAVSPCGHFVLVGFVPDESLGASLTASAPVHLYTAPTGEFVVELVSDALWGVSAVSFSKQGSLAAALGRDAQHTLYVFKSFSGRWDDALLLNRTHCSAAQIDLLAFLVAPDTQLSSHHTCNEIVTAGDGRIKFWRVDGLNLLCETGIYGEEGSGKESDVAVTAVAGGTGNGARDEAITGDAHGRVFLWRGKYRHRLLETHPSAITAMSSFSSADGSKAGVIITSKDGLSVWTTATNVTLLAQISLYDVLSRLGWSSALYTNSLLPVVCNVSSDPEARQILLSMSNGLLLNFSTDSGNVRKLMEGHGNAHKVNQMVAHPSNDHLVVTVCDDNALRVWDISGDLVQSGVSLKPGVPTRPRHAATLVGFLALSHPATAVTFLKDHTMLVAMSNADKDGVSGAIVSVEIKKSASHSDGDATSGPPYLLSILHRYHNVGKGAVRQLRLSPGNKMLASSSEDGCVYIHKVSAKEDSLEPVGRLLAHIDGSPVVAADFSQDGRYVRSFGENHLATCGQRIEVNLFDFQLDGGANTVSMNPLNKIAGGKVQDVGALESLKSVSWASVGSPAAAEVRCVSITPQKEISRTDSLAVSEDGQFVCCGYIDGSIKVFRFPVHASAPAAELKFALHGQGGAHVAFLKKQSHYSLVSLGKTDNVFMVHVLDV